MFGYLRETLLKVMDREDKPLISIEPKVDFTILTSHIGYYFMFHCTKNEVFY